MGECPSPWLDVFLHLFIANENKKDEGFDVELQEAVFSFQKNILYFTARSHSSSRNTICILNRSM